MLRRDSRSLRHMCSRCRWKSSRALEARVEPVQVEAFPSPVWPVLDAWKQVSPQVQAVAARRRPETPAVVISSRLPERQGSTVWAETNVPESRLYNDMIREAKDPARAISIFTKMKESGVEPNRTTYDLLVQICLTHSHTNTANFKALFDLSSLPNSQPPPAQTQHTAHLSNGYHPAHHGRLLDRSTARKSPLSATPPPPTAPAPATVLAPALPAPAPASAPAPAPASAPAPAAAPAPPVSAPTPAATASSQTSSKSSRSLCMLNEREKIFQMWTDRLADENMGGHFSGMEQHSRMGENLIWQEGGMSGRHSRRTFEGAAGQEDSRSCLFMEQIMMEKKAAEQFALKYQHVTDREHKSGRGASMAPAQKLIAKWFGPMVEAINNQMDQYRSGVSVRQRDSQVLGPFLLTLRPEILAVLTLHTIVNTTLSDADGVKMVHLCSSIGGHIQAEHNMQVLKKNKLAYEEFRTMSRKKRSRIMIPMINSKAEAYVEHEGQWSQQLTAKMGSLMVQLALKSAKFKDPRNGEVVPAFQHGYLRAAQRSLKMKMIGVIRVHPLVREQLLRGQGRTGLMTATHLPMLVPPKPWLSCDIGGYLSQRVFLMRFATDAQRRALREAESNMDQLYASLNVLSQVPWRLNKPVYEVVLRLWEDGGDFGKLPPRRDEPLPPCPMPGLDKKPRSEMNEHELKVHKEWRRRLNKVDRHNANLFSQRCDIFHKLETAKLCKDRVFYFPHSIDFRGRAYPIPPHLNHMGSDLSRGILVFAEGRPLGPRGLHWLKVQVANTYGEDKKSIEDRVKFVNDNMDQVLLSARDPLGAGLWWKEAEEKFQCLAGCIAIAEAMAMDRPEEYVCHVPVQQDGSCNGLQHYAALGRDEAGARAVNLLPSEKPQDVYSEVLQQVIERVEKDAEQGHACAVLLQSNLTRKVVKQTVMTSVYGVTFVGARNQILARLEERGTIPQEKLFACSSYLARYTLNGLEVLFKSAFMIMGWLAKCASLIAHEGKESTAWTTPLGLAVVQPYHNKKAQSIKTAVQNITVVNRSESRKVAKGRQKSAFPPNYVHSLDSTHMLMTALECEKLGLTFAAVHDSFWTHPSGVDEMSRVLREQFIKLHKRPLLEDLKTEFEAKYPSIAFPDLPPRGDLELDSVRDSQYFFA